MTRSRCFSAANRCSPTTLHAARRPIRTRPSSRWRRGENHLLLKIVNAGGPAGFYFKLGGSALPENILALLREDVLNAGHISKLCDYYEKSQWPLGRELDARMKSAEKAVTDYDKSIVTVMTMGDLAKPRKTYVLARGHYASPKKDEEISPGIPSRAAAVA